MFVFRDVSRRFSGGPGSDPDDERESPPRQFLINPAIPWALLCLLLALLETFDLIVVFFASMTLVPLIRYVIARFWHRPHVA